MEKRGKEIILLVLAAVLVAVAAVTLFQRSGPPPKPPVADQVQEEVVAKESDKEDLPTPQALLGGSPGTSASRNPFSQPGGGGPPPKAPAEPAEPAPSSGGEPGAALPPLVPPGGVGTLPSDLTPDVLHLTGVIRGEKTLAVLRKGETRYFVNRGDKVEGNYVVTYIGANSVTLRTNEGDKINLILGGGR
ncbi:MAG: hypothetical protein GTN69_02985 [Armatimonadetes bacterium]|nr:hypothetical protein [Armatimonadota bacterium]NIO74863.1 hypothetical protein [Armatimonadota bacterium]NIO95625.1 hypothetical protein [Armatimonadota bacterium]